MTHSQQLSDALLVKNYINGQEAALAILVDRHQAKLFGFICSKVQDRTIAEDLFQDTFIKVIKKLKANCYNEEGKFLPWLMRIAHNLVVDHFRNAKKMPYYRETEEYSIFDFMKDSGLNIETKIMKEQTENTVCKLLQDLPLDQQEIIKLKFFDDLTFKEISELKDISINTALGRMRYAVMNMRKLIEKNKLVLTN
jgi:RNA polymerase sigma-70 factor, ECF subfamily